MLNLAWLKKPEIQECNAKNHNRTTSGCTVYDSHSPLSPSPTDSIAYLKLTDIVTWYYWFSFREKLEGSQRLQFSSRSLPRSNHGYTTLYSSTFRILLIRTFYGGIIHSNKPFHQTVTWFLYALLITCEDQKGWMMAMQVLFLDQFEVVFLMKNKKGKDWGQYSAILGGQICSKNSFIICPLQ